MNKFTVMCVVCVLLGVINTVMIVDMILDKPKAEVLPEWPKPSCYQNTKGLYQQSITGDFGMVLSCIKCEDHRDKYVVFQEVKMYYSHVDCELAKVSR